jgi:hypothetical protein
MILRVDLHRAQGQLIDIRFKAHNQNIRLDHPNKLSVTRHSVNLRYHMQLQKTRATSTKSRHMNRIVREATEIELHPKTWTGRTEIFNLLPQRP